MPFNKLVRDKIPDIIRKTGRTPVTTIASEDEYKALLREKLKEEVNEFLSGESPEELADILEVVYALGEVRGLTKEHLEALRQKKADERGGFRGRIVLKETLSEP